MARSGSFGVQIRVCCMTPFPLLCYTSTLDCRHHHYRQSSWRHTDTRNRVVAQVPFARALERGKLMSLFLRNPAESCCKCVKSPREQHSCYCCAHYTLQGSSRTKHLFAGPAKGRVQQAAKQGIKILPKEGEGPRPYPPTRSRLHQARAAISPWPSAQRLP